MNSNTLWAVVLASVIAFNVGSYAGKDTAREGYEAQEKAQQMEYEEPYREAYWEIIHSFEKHQPYDAFGTLNMYIGDHDLGITDLEAYAAAASLNLFCREVMDAVEVLDDYSDNLKAIR